MATAGLTLRLCVAVCSALFVTGTNEFTAEAKGKEVVDAVVDMIGKMCLTDNDIFLRRMANVETQYGNDPQTYRPGYNGGIWNIGENLFRQTQNNPALTNEYNTIKSVLHIDWSTVSWSDLRKPIYSGVAATLLILSKNIRHIPESAELQSTIWSVLRPGNTPFDYFQITHNSVSECSPTKNTDLVIVLDFKQINSLEFLRVRTFLDLFLKQLMNRGTGTKVGIVTKKPQPTAAWYLNSGRPGFTILTGLQALHYVPGPASTADMLDFARTNMFTAANGARTGTAHVTLLLTDSVTQISSAKVAAQKLESDGTSLVIVEINNSTSSGNAQQLASPPVCNNVKHITSYDNLSDFLERVDERVCRAPISLSTSGNQGSGNTHPCSSTMVARLPDSSDSVSVKVTTTSGTVTLYASKNNAKPDENSHDVKLVTSSGGTTTPILYVRGTNPVYIRVEGQGQGNTCSGTYKVEVKVQDLFKGENGVCFVADTVRPCSSIEMDMTSHDVVLLTDKNIPNICNPSTHTVEYFPHPVDPKKFIMCDQHEQTYVGLCPVNQPPPNCLQLSSGCRHSNPCTQQGILNAGNMYHNDPCGNQTNYIECTQLGIAKVKSCPTTRVWNQDTHFCVFKYVHDPKDLRLPGDTSVENPCVHSHEDHVYFPYPGNPKKYILCDVHGNAFGNTCIGNSLWNQQTKTCTMVSPPLVG